MNPGRVTPDPLRESDRDHGTTIRRVALAGLTRL